MKIEMVKLNRIKYAYSEEEKKRLISEGYVPTQTRSEKPQTADPDSGQTADPDNGQTADPDNGQIADPDKGTTKTTNKRGTNKK